MNRREMFKALAAVPAIPAVAFAGPEKRVFENADGLVIKNCEVPYGIEITNSRHVVVTGNIISGFK